MNTRAGEPRPVAVDQPRQRSRSAQSDTTQDNREQANAPNRRWSLVQEYARMPGRGLLRGLSAAQRWAHRWFAPREPTVVPYVGYGSRRGEARVFARVLEESGERPPSVDDSVWKNFVRSYHQWGTAELPDVTVEVACGGKRVEVESDEAGYLDVRFDAPQLEAGWAPVRFRWKTIRGTDAHAQGQLLVPAADQEFGIISDIDDTILQTNVQNRARMVALSVFGNALTRLGYPGTTEWYQGMVLQTQAPVFYVSRSAWNLFALLREFIEHQGLPPGPLILRDVGLRRGKERRRGHKFRRMSEFFELYPQMRFICIGDSGQRDAEIYAALARHYPGRVAAIYIRDVGDPTRRMIAQAACETADVPYLLFVHSVTAQNHARRLGLWRSS